MVVLSKPIPINQRREYGFHRRNNRFSEQRMQGQRDPGIPEPMYPSPQGSPPQVPGFPLGNYQGWSISPPTQPHTTGFLPGPAFPAGPHPLDNVNGFANQNQYIEMRDDRTPSPPAGYSATSMYGFNGSPPYPMPLRNEFYPPANAHPHVGIFNSTPPQYEESGEPRGAYQQDMYPGLVQVRWPPNQFLPPNFVAMLPSPPAVPIEPCGVNGCNCSSQLPQPQREQSFAYDLPMMYPPYHVDPSRLGRMPEVVEPPPRPVVYDNGNVNGSQQVRKRRTQGKKFNVGNENQAMKMSEDESSRLGNRQRSSSTPATSFAYCSFCKSNRETRHFYQSHVLKNDDGVITCPVLRKYTCPLCQAVGDNAHTLKYCPENEDGVLNSRGRSMSFSSQRSALKKKRNSRGVIGAYRYG